MEMYTYPITVEREGRKYWAYSEDFRGYTDSAIPSTKQRAASLNRCDFISMSAELPTAQYLGPAPSNLYFEDLTFLPR